MHGVTEILYSKPSWYPTYTCSVPAEGSIIVIIILIQLLLIITIILGNQS